MMNNAKSILAFSMVAKSVINQVLSGITYLHSEEKQIVYYNIKPWNILLDMLGKVTLIDFSIAYSPTSSSQDVWPKLKGNM
jgi:serine/threonine protein kinase